MSHYDDDELTTCGFFLNMEERPYCFMKIKNVKRLSFFDLWLRHQFSLYLLAKEASVDEYIVELMHNMQPVKQEDAQKVLAILTRCYHTDYTLETVSIPLIENIPIPKEKSEMVQLLERIDLESQSSMLGLYGTAIVGSHDILERRNAHVGTYVVHWIPTVGEKSAMDAYRSWAENASEDIFSIRG